MQLNINKDLIKFRKNDPQDTASQLEAPAVLFRTLRETANMSQADVAMLLGITTPSVSQMETTKQTIHFKHLEKLADFVGVVIVLSIVSKKGPPDLNKNSTQDNKVS